MPLAPMLVVGCGGSGGKVLLNLRSRLGEELSRRGWHRGIPESFQFKWIDVPSEQEAHPQFGPPLPLDDYLGLARAERFEAYDTTVTQVAGPQRMDRLTGWRPSPATQLPVSQGAGQMRAIGRVVALSKADAISNVINSGLQSIKAGQGEMALLAQHLGGEKATAHDTPIVVVVSSLAGGTGAGIFLDVCDLVRSADADLGQKIAGILFTAEIFADVKANAGMPSNTFAAASEMMNGLLSVQRSAEPLYGPGAAMKGNDSAGPTVPYVVGLQTLAEGRSLASPGECYRAVTESLIAMMTDAQLQQDVIAYDLTNRVKNADPTERATSYRILNESPGMGALAKCGLISSFGSSKVSVGSARFGEWARDRLSRSVVSFVVDGWRHRGLELLDRAQRETATDEEIVRFLVRRDREVFFSACGLWEENEPDGTEHNEVLDGVADDDALKRIASEFRSELMRELGSQGDRTGAQWITLIGDAIRSRQVSGFDAKITSALLAGSAEFGQAVVPRLSEAVSKWLAEFGQPVTLGLVAALRAQCTAASVQLANEAVAFGERAVQDPTPAMAASFQGLGNGQASSGSDFVADAIRRAIGPPLYAARRQRAEVAGAILVDVVEKVLDPLLGELEQVGRDLTHPTFVDQLDEWPDGPGVSSLYAPPPSEFSLVGVDKWDAKYEELLKASVGSVEGARDLIGQGGFTFGPVGARQDAPHAVVLEENRQKGWLGRDGRPVTVTIALRPEDVLARVRLWLSDEGHPMGRFLKTGLAEYLSREDRGQPVPDHLDRLERFRSALTEARQLAQPLFRVNPGMMQRVHPGHDRLEAQLRVQSFPFDPVHPARPIVEDVLHGLDAPTAGWCSSTNSAGVESVLAVSRLVFPVQPAAVASLYQPIVQAWNAAIHAPNPSKAIEGFWSFNRARLLTEFIPLPRPSLEKVVRGWFVGRLLGAVTDPTETTGPQVRGSDQHGQPVVGELPWPLLRHGRQQQLHLPRNRMELLPALLEHVGLAMMLLSQDPHILDGYEMLYVLGDTSGDVLERWIETGTGPAGVGATTQATGTNPEERSASLQHGLAALRSNYEQTRLESIPKLGGTYETFMTIPYGYELIPLITAQLGQLETETKSIPDAQWG